MIRRQLLVLLGLLALCLAWPLGTAQAVEPDTALRYAPAAQPMSGPAGHRDSKLLAYDPKGNGRIVEVFGDLATADRIAIFVPGCGWRLGNYWSTTDPMSPRRAARTLLAEARRLDPHAKVAAIAWLGYEPPDGIDLDALRSDRAIAGAPQLADLTKDLPGKANVTLICHSYASVLCGRAVEHDKARVDDLAVVGATGLDVGRAAELDTSARIWAGRTADDGMRFLPPVRFGGLGHGGAPTSPGFGARVFATGNVHGHSHYYEPGSASMTNLTRIVLGQDGEVSHG